MTHNATQKFPHKVSFQQTSVCLGFVPSGQCYNPPPPKNAFYSTCVWMFRGPPLTSANSPNLDSESFVTFLFIGHGARSKKKTLIACIFTFRHDCDRTPSSHVCSFNHKYNHQIPLEMLWKPAEVVFVLGRSALTSLWMAEKWARL